jgi:hypothetical protein
VLGLLLSDSYSFSRSILPLLETDYDVLFCCFFLSQEEKRRLKEEIERRRAEAAEKRQKMPEDGLSDDKKPFKCFTPKGSSLKVFPSPENLHIAIPLILET